MFTTNLTNLSNTQLETAQKLPTQLGSAAVAVVGVVKVSSIGIGRKGVRFKRAFIMLRYAKKKMSHSTILFAWRLRECVSRHFGSVAFQH